MKINPEIFKAYDIRGKYPQDLNEKVAYKIGQAYVKFLDKPKMKIAVGFDMRSSSPSLFQSLTKGIRDQGAKVVDIGLATTPMLYFSVIQYGLDGGINITGSHTPQYHNGFKLVREKAIPISGDSGIEDIKRLTEADFKSKKVGKISKKNVLKSYIEY